MCIVEYDGKSITIGIVYSWWTIYLPGLKLIGQRDMEISVAQGVGDQHDLWPWPTDLNINRDRLRVKDYVPTMSEASGTKHYWVISCTRLRDTDSCIRCWRPAWPLTDLLTYISIGIIYSWWTIYLSSLKRLGQRDLRYRLHKVWETNMTFDLLTWISIEIIYS